MDVLMDEIIHALAGVLKRLCENLASTDMTENKEFDRIDKTMRKVPGFRSSKRVSPRSCRECEFHQPSWKYRSCYYPQCHYHKSGSTIRDVPLKENPFPTGEVVRLSGL